MARIHDNVVVKRVLPPFILRKTLDGKEKDNEQEASLRCASDVGSRSHCMSCAAFRFPSKIWQEKEFPVCDQEERILCKSQTSLQSCRRQPE
ncbi:hypothetical protein ABFA07_011893 [Porites harrisoni]